MTLKELTAFGLAMLVDWAYPEILNGSHLSLVPLLMPTRGSSEAKIDFFLPLR